MTLQHAAVAMKNRDSGGPVRAVSRKKASLLPGVKKIDFELGVARLMSDVNPQYASYLGRIGLKVKRV